MELSLSLAAASVRQRAGLILLCILPFAASASDWPQYRGPNTDGTTPDACATVWATNSPNFVVWRNPSVTNGFSTFAVSQGRAFVLISRLDDNNHLREYCVALDAATGTNIWATPTDVAPWDPSVTGNGGDGIAPWNTGDGPRTTPSVKDDRVVTLSGYMHLYCLNVTNGALLWDNDLAANYGASSIPWENAASPTVDNDLVFVNLNTASDSKTLAAFRLADGSVAWHSQNEGLTHTTPTVATIQGVRQVIFATVSGLVSLDRSTGSLLWKYVYPFGSIGTSMGASPIVYSNVVYCTAAYFKGAAAIRVTLTNTTWTVSQIFYKTPANYRSIWMSPVCYQGHVYSLAGENSTFLSAPLNCIELATGNLKWTVNNFGMGGLILVNTNLLLLTEEGQLVLIQPNPAAYTELVRYQAFEFTADAPGKCWVHPAFSNGRIYAHSTAGAICLDVSVPALAPLPQLKLLAPQFLNRTQLQLVIGTSDGSPINSNRLAKLEVHATNVLGSAQSTWPKLTNPLVLGSDGLVRLTNTIDPAVLRQFYSTVELP